MTTTICRMGETAISDRKFTADEAKAIVAKAKSNGIVSAQEKADLRAIMAKYADAFDSKLAGVMVFAQSLAVDEGYRDNEVFKTFLARYNLPETITLSSVNSALAAHTGHNYAGDPAVIAKLKGLISADALAALKRPEVGVPVTIL